MMLGFYMVQTLVFGGNGARPSSTQQPLCCVMNDYICKHMIQCEWSEQSAVRPQAPCLLYSVAYGALAGITQPATQPCLE